MLIRVSITDETDIPKELSSIVIEIPDDELKGKTHQEKMCIQWKYAVDAASEIFITRKGILK
jgi:hypothetical protein